MGSLSNSLQECVFFCVREEPVVFLRLEGDFVSYTPRGKENLHENLQRLQRGLRAESLELAVRKEVRWDGRGSSLHTPPPPATGSKMSGGGCWRWWAPHGF